MLTLLIAFLFSFMETEQSYNRDLLCVLCTVFISSSGRDAITAY